MEIDESVITRKAKNNKGRRHKKIWVFGMIERHTRKMSLHVVQDRSKETLMPILQKHVDKRTKIYHDDWASYRDLKSYGYEHGAVNHTKEFVSADGVCTNTIEGVWGLVKSRIRKMHGIQNRANTQDVLDEFVYRYRHKYTLYKTFLQDISEQYKL